MVRRRIRTVVAIAAILLGITTAPSAQAGIPSCPWAVSTVKSGLGSLENLAFDGSGAMLLSRTVGGAGQLYRLGADGAGATLANGLDAPGGITVEGDTTYFTTGNSLWAGLFGLGNGAIVELDLSTGATRTVASGLTMPNGMARLPDGSFVVSRNLGLSTGLTRVSADGATSSRFAPHLVLTNGVAYDPGRNAVITSLDFSPVSTLAIIDAADSHRILQRIDLGLFGLVGFPDDLTVGPDGMIYLAMDLGPVVRIDPDRRTACRLTPVLLGSTSVKFGAGPGWDAQSLYVTSLAGFVTRLTPGPTSPPHTAPDDAA
ncbi:hypothetical protein BVC93_06045 [Mycobacterium sp. MS1601]|nr:hypothetical protein BVC93_06045 [Mycobacterium sp. MS1601]